MSPPLIALLALETRQLFRADVLDVALVGGTTYRWTTGDGDLSYNGRSYSAGGQTGPYISRPGNKAQARWRVGVEVDTYAFDIMPGTAQIAGAPFLQAALSGAFDGAEVTVRRLLMPTYGDTRRGAIPIFVGRIADIDPSRSMLKVTVSSHLELLNQQSPRNVWHAGCSNNLGDDSCGVVIASFSSAGTALAGSTKSTIVANLAGAPVGRFDQGKITFTSGNLAGNSRTVKTGTFGTPGSIALLSPFPSAPSPGDAFTIFAGCDKSLGSNGCTKFANTARFRGQPYIPAAETAI